MAGGAGLQPGGDGGVGGAAVVEQGAVQVEQDPLDVPDHAAAPEVTRAAMRVAVSRGG